MKRMVAACRSFSVLTILGLLFFFTFVDFADAQNADPSDTLSRLLAQEDQQISLAHAKLELDALIDPSFDAETIHSEVRSLADGVLRKVGISASDNEMMIAMRTIIYEPGPWNDNRAFQYDHNDPRGKNVRHKTMAYYMESRLGNCITMPILIMMVGEELGLDMGATTAPVHMMVKFTPSETGKAQNIEGTSGGYSQTLKWMRSQLPMSDEAIASGMYMAELDNHQSIAVMAETLLQDLRERGEFEEIIEVSDLMLGVFPEFDVAHLNRADAYHRLLEQRYYARFPTPNHIPDELLAEYQRLNEERYSSLGKLEAFGWRPIRLPR